jgi:hypothetical protein
MGMYLRLAFAGFWAVFDQPLGLQTATLSWGGGLQMTAYAGSCDYYEGNETLSGRNSVASC